MSLDRDTKEELKQALREWLDEKYTEFGKFAFRSLLALGLAAIVYFILISQGWKPPI